MICGIPFLYSFNMIGWLPSGHRDPLGRGELASIVTQGTVGWCGGGAELEALGRLFLGAAGAVSQLAPTALSLFGLLNLCFGSLFHTL